MQPTNLNSKKGNNLLIKGIMVWVLIMVMLIPAHFVSELVEERQTRQEQVVNEVSGKWAGDQTVTGPVLMLPYLEEVTLKNNEKSIVTKMAYILPDELKITSTIEPVEKKRSLYSVMLYHSTIRLNGKFGKLPLSDLQIDPASVVWKDARIAIGTQDGTGIDDQGQVKWNGAQFTLDQGLPVNDVFTGGICGLVDVNAADSSVFSISLSLNGAGKLYFSPVGKVTQLDMSAPWKDPAFDGKFLPVHSEVTKDKFSAQWKILPISHAAPKYWKDHAQNLTKDAFGVRLIQTTDGYSRIHRSVKYAMLFITLTFVFFFFLEAINNRRIHPVQYLLVGAALTIFYTLLLSISEYTGFNIAYMIAAVAIISLVTFYVHGIFRKRRIIVGFAASITALYTYIFVIIQSEDYALLLGSVGLFIIMAVIMYFSRGIEWYPVPETPKSPEFPGLHDHTFQPE
jgi:inner membrane protein